MGNTGRVAQAVGVDVGGSGIKGALVDVLAGSRVGDRVRLLTPQPATPPDVAAVVAQVLEGVDGLFGGAEGSGRLGITIPGVVRDGVVRTAANIDKAWIGTDAVELFSGALGRDVVVVNDADAAGVAEAAFGAGRDRAGVVVVLTVGTGIGSAVLVDGVLVPNTELGHLPLHHGSAEEWAADSVREREGLSWEKWAGRLQTYLELVERLLWPSLIILGGGVSKKTDRFLQHVAIDTEVVPAELRNDAGIVGAALLASLGP